MFRPSLKSVWTLIILAILSYGLYLWAEHSRTRVQRQYFETKMQASQLMARAVGMLRDYRLQKGVRVDEVNDPNLTALIGPQHSLITTDDGHLQDRITCLNPNMAAMAVALLMEAKLKDGDHVAVALTGSNPGVNIAVYSAIKVLNLQPVIVSSAGSASWGATNPNFTWLDMEKVLYERGVFPFRSVAASLGGGDDLGRRLSQRGRQILVDNIDSNDVELILETTLRASIDTWMGIYEEHQSNPGYKTFINIGEGVASLGHAANGNLIPDGYNPRIPPKNYPARGLMHRFSDEKCSVVNIYDIRELAERYHLPQAPVPTPPVGEGDIFWTIEYDLTVTWVAIAILAVVLFVLIRLDADLFKMKEKGVDPDTLM
jgi:poly-gamma-glutamate system protein